MQIRRRVTIVVPSGQDESHPFAEQAAKWEQLLQEGRCTDVRSEGGVVSARRGSLFWSLCGTGDPRRWRHTIEVTSSGTTYDVETYYGLFTRADEEVFRSEGEEMDRFVRGEPSGGLLLGALRACRVSSALTLAAASVVGGTIALVVWWLFLR